MPNATTSAPVQAEPRPTPHFPRRALGARLDDLSPHSRAEWHPRAVTAIIDAVAEGFRAAHDERVEYAVRVVGDIPADRPAITWLADEVVRQRAAVQALAETVARLNSIIAKEADPTLAAELIGAFAGHSLLPSGQLALVDAGGSGVAWSSLALPVWVRETIRQAQPVIDERRREVRAQLARAASGGIACPVPGTEADRDDFPTPSGTAAPSSITPASPVQRSLVKVIDDICTIAPDLRSQLQGVRKSAMYAAPESMSLHWQQTATILDLVACDHPNAPQIRSIFSGSVGGTNPPATRFKVDPGDLVNDDLEVSMSKAASQAAVERHAAPKPTIEIRQA